jgi:hypothetical protein
VEHYESNDFILLYENVIGLIARIKFCVVNETAEHYNFCYVHQVVLKSDFTKKNKIYFHTNRYNTETVEYLSVRHYL